MSERIPRRRGVEPVQGILQLAQPLLELGADGPLQELPHLGEAGLESGIREAGSLSGARDLLEPLAELSRPRLDLGLLLLDRGRPLGRLERKRP